MSIAFDFIELPLKLVEPPHPHPILLIRNIVIAPAIADLGDRFGPMLPNRVASPRLDGGHHHADAPASRERHPSCRATQQQIDKNNRINHGLYSPGNAEQMVWRQ
jgi:hypothetical protein